MGSSLRPIPEVAAELGVAAEHVVPWGRDAAKLELDTLDDAPRGAGRLVLVSAITPTRSGEGKTTVSVGLAMGMRRLGHRTVVCLREPSLGPVFGLKGGGTGGGRAQVEPADRINLHFTGDMHAITSAHDLLAALVDNDLHFGAASGLTPGTVTWPRVLDVDDRALRRIRIDVGGRAERETRFDITAASEAMAVLCLSRSVDELRARLGRMVVGTTAGGSLVTAEDLDAADAMTVLLRDALLPNLVQTRDGGPALVHGGPFANIAHGCSSVVATTVAMRHADVTITEAGFGFDLGGEKMLHIVCRQAGLWPRCVVLVVTARALAAHGGVRHLSRQLDNVGAFGLEPVVAVNPFPGDDETDLERIESFCRERGVRVARCTAFTDGGAGGEGLARAVGEVLEATDASPPEPRHLYAPDDGLVAKLRSVARTLYGAEDVVLAPEATEAAKRLEASGHGHLPPCIAKTHLSLTDDPKRPEADGGPPLTVRDLRLSAGAGFVVALAGSIRTMPGLPRQPAALRIRLGPDGRAHGLLQEG